MVWLEMTQFWTLMSQIWCLLGYFKGAQRLGLDWIISLEHPDIRAILAAAKA
jgi:hypothetical protein